MLLSKEIDKIQILFYTAIFIVTQLFNIFVAGVDGIFSITACEQRAHACKS